MAAEPKRTAGDDRVLPPEIWREILSRVPVKSILRFRSVCKSWYSLVSCPNFISHYSVRNLNKNGHRILLQPGDEIGGASPYPFSSHDESFLESREHDDVPEAFLDSHVHIVGTCNGLICLSKYHHQDPEVTFLIWNPTIRKVVELPSRTINSHARHFSYRGFGFDFKTGDYKVMCMHSANLGTRSSDCYNADANVCEIFDLRKGVWRGISPLVQFWNVNGLFPECYLNGAVHWSSSVCFSGNDRILLSFDMSDETFREIRMPDCAEFVWNGDGDCPIDMQSVTFGGLIHVIVWKYDWDDHVVDVNEECSVWAMKEYGVVESWTKLFNIDLEVAKVLIGTEPSEFRLWENGEVLMVLDVEADGYYGDRQELVLYNTESRECKLLFSFITCIRDMCFYEESLVLM